MAIKSPQSAGGIARAKKLNSERRTEIAQQGAAKHWDLSIPNASHEGILRIGEKEIKCVVTENGDRVLSVANVFETFGRSARGYKRINREVIRPPFIDALNLKDYISPALEELCKPIEYKNLKGKLSKGYKAEILAEICLTYMHAYNANKLVASQKNMFIVSTIIISALSKVGIIALIDEATGYQRDRAKDALAQILESFIAKELQPYIATIPAAFYENLFRLRGKEYTLRKVEYPRYFGTLTNNIVYSRLAPGILDELKQGSERNEKGRLKHKYFQKLTRNTGYQKLKEHLASVVSIMRLSTDYKDFMTKLNTIHPQCSLDDFDETKDTGTGL